MISHTSFLKIMLKVFCIHHLFLILMVFIFYVRQINFRFPTLNGKSFHFINFGSYLNCTLMISHTSFLKIMLKVFCIHHLFLILIVFTFYVWQISFRFPTFIGKSFHFINFGSHLNFTLMICHTSLLKITLKMFGIHYLFLILMVSTFCVWQISFRFPTFIGKSFHFINFGSYLNCMICHTSLFHRNLYHRSFYIIK